MAAWTTPTPGEEEAPGVLVSAFLLVDDIDWLLTEFRQQATHIQECRRTQGMVFQAFDDPREVMIVQELDTEEHAWSWTRRHDAATEWMERTGVGSTVVVRRGVPGSVARRRR